MSGEIVSGAVLSYDGRNITTDAFRATVGSHCSVMLTSGIEVFGEVIRVSTQHNVVSLYESFQISVLVIVHRLDLVVLKLPLGIVYWVVLSMDRAKL